MEQTTRAKGATAKGSEGVLGVREAAQAQA